MPRYCQGTWGTLLYLTICCATVGWYCPCESLDIAKVIRTPYCIKLFVGATVGTAQVNALLPPALGSAIPLLVTPSRSFLVTLVPDQPRHCSVSKNRLKKKKS
ncbi:unnamed protein product [Choristocarpus tenellus]